MILTISKQMSSLFFSSFIPLTIFSSYFVLVFPPACFLLYCFHPLDLNSIMYSNDRGSKADMQAAAGGAEYVGDEQGIMEGEQQYP